LNLSWTEGEKISGYIPVAIGQLDSLELLDLSNNLLTADIPSALEKLVNLTTLNLSDNFLVGAIPAFISLLDSLQVLDLSGNLLLGDIPESLGDLVNLDELYLENNRLSGILPSFPNLTVFYQGNEGIVTGKETPESINFDQNQISSDPLVIHVVIIIAALLAVIALGAVITAVCIFKRSKHGNSWNGTASSYSASEAEFEPPVEMHSFFVAPLEAPRGRTPGRTNSRSTKSLQLILEDLEIVWVSKLSTGTFGEAWKCKYDGRDVAIKKMMTGVNASDKIRFIERFAEEAKIMRQMKHKRIGMFFQR
jgi:hypothetical protein